MMFLFVSRTCIKQAYIKQACLVVATSVLSLAVHAELPVTSEKSAHHHQPQQNKMTGDRPQNFNFPQWPQPRQMNSPQSDKEIIPPPPPGPYMSSALSDYTVDIPAANRMPARYPPHNPANRYGAASTPMGTFSPDIPWPENLRQSPGDGRMPETGYRKPSPQSQRRSYPAPSGAPAGRDYNSAYRYNPYNNGMMNGSRWAPNMGFAPQMPNQWSGSNNNGTPPPGYPYRQYNMPRYPNQGR